MSEWDNLSEQLRKLGVTIGAQKSDLVSPKKRWPIETVLECNETQTPSGVILSAKHRFDASYAQGKVQLAPSTQFNKLLQWAHISIEENIKLENLIFLDTETTGLSHGTGTMAFMVGVGKFEKDIFGKVQFILEQFFLRNPSEEEAFLYALSLFCKDMKAVVTYNGKAFDIPILNTLHILQRVPSPFVDAYHIDLLTISRQLWRLRLTQCRLANIEQSILEFEREGGEVPGYLAPEFYKDYLQTGDARPLKGVFYHNQEDVVSLAALFSLVAKILENPTSEELIHANDMYSVARVFERLEDIEAAHLLYSRSLQTETDQELSVRYLLTHAQFLRKNQDLEGAVSLWTQAAELDNVEALICLAKHYEHKTKDLQSALTMTLKALEIVENKCDSANAILEKLYHRKKRIEDKLTKGSHI